MKSLFPFLIALAAVPVVADADEYPYLLLSPGSVCQPTTPQAPIQGAMP